MIYAAACNAPRCHPPPYQCEEWRVYSYTRTCAQRCLGALPDARKTQACPYTPCMRRSNTPAAACCCQAPYWLASWRGIGTIQGRSEPQNNTHCLWQHTHIATRPAAVRATVANVTRGKSDSPTQQHPESKLGAEKYKTSGCRAGILGSAVMHRAAPAKQLLRC